MQFNNNVTLILIKMENTKNCRAYGKCTRTVNNPDMTPTFSHSHMLG